MLKQSSLKILDFCYLMISDAVILYFSFLLAYYIRFYHSLNLLPVAGQIPDFAYYNDAIFLAIMICLVVFGFSGRGAVKTHYFFDDAINVFNSSLISFLLILAGTFFYRGFSFSRIVMSISFVIVVFLISLNHSVYRQLRQFLINRFMRKREILIVGLGKIAQLIKTKTKKNMHSRFYFVEDAGLERIETFLKGKKVQEVILTRPPAVMSELEKIIVLCENSRVDLKIIPSVMELKLGEVIIDYDLGIPTLSLKSISMETSNFITKRMFDIVFTIAVLTFSLPVLLAMALLILITSPSGPILYSHKRRGFKGVDFNFFKFRTMIKDAEKYLEGLKKISDRSGPVFKIKKDPRVIFVGGFLRKFSLDEFPQFINVLKGEMSIVGPRPQVLWEAEAYDRTAKRRLNAMPGITGLWQISGRADVSYEEMIDLDIYYLENWTLALDIRILLMTIPAMFRARGAY